MYRKLKVLQVVASLHLGGFERVVSNICKNIDKNRFNIAVFCVKHTNGFIGKQLQDEGFNIQGASAQNSSSRKSKYLSFLKLHDYSKKAKIDILHSHGSTGFVDAGFVSLISKSVKHIHTFHFGNYPNRPPKKFLLEFIFSRVPKQLVAVSHHQRNLLIKNYKLDPKRILTIWNGVKEVNKTTDIQKIKTEFNIPMQSPVVGTIANLIEQKGYEYFLQTCQIINKSLPNVYFVIIGGGPLELQVIEQAHHLGIQHRVIFAGSRTDAPALLPAFDVFLLASLWEAMPLVLLEAMAAGIPIIATDVGDNGLIVSDGEAGFIVPVKDVLRMASHVKQLLQDRHLSVTMGAIGKERFKCHFSAKTMVTQYEALYESLITTKSHINR